MKNARPLSSTGFTLVEIMIVVVIIGLLAAIAIPAFNRARQSSRYGNIMNNLREIGQGANQYFLERGRNRVAFSEIIDRDAYVSVFNRVAREEYGSGSGLQNPIDGHRGLYAEITGPNNVVGSIHTPNNIFSPALAATIVADNSLHTVVYATRIAGAANEAMTLGVTF